MMNNADRQYQELLQTILDTGEDRGDRTGVGTRSIFGHQMRFDLSEGFPAITTKKLAWRAVVSELLWFMEGSTNERRLAEILYEDIRENLKDRKTIWTANADAQGKALGYQNNNLIKDLGPVYGRMWRDFNGYDQLKTVISDIVFNPESRRIIMSAWNPTKLDQMALPPCHVLTQFYVSERGLSCHMYQRSVDTFLGLPFNIASYALLTHILAAITNNDVADFVWSGGDIHIYTTHMDAVEELLSRKPRELPTLKLPNLNSLDDVLASKTSDYQLEGYTPHSTIRAEMAV